MDRHLTSLIARHRALDLQIARESRRPGAPATMLRNLKRMRLSLKDEIAGLRTRRRVQPS